MTKVPKIENQLIQRDILLHVVRFQLSQAQAQMKMNYNELRLEYEFKEGDQVYIWLFPYCQFLVLAKTNEKLS